MAAKGWELTMQEIVIYGLVSLSIRIVDCRNETLLLHKKKEGVCSATKSIAAVQYGDGFVT